MRQALGKGIGALIPKSQTRADEGRTDASPEASRALVSEVPVADVVANPRQPRGYFDADGIAELTESIRVHGVLQPILVRALPGGGFELIAGERRLRASRAAGLAKVPALVKQTADDDSLVLAIVENVQRAQLSPLEEARAYRALLDDFGLTQDEVAGRVGRSRPAVANTMRLLQLPDEIQAEIERGNLTAGHARALLGLDGETAMKTLGREIVRRKLSVREAEAEVKRTPKAGRKPARRDPDVARIEADLGRLLGSKVSIRPGRKGTGTLEIAFYSDDDLARLTDLLATVRRPMSRGARA
ncbi:ParB/RepB/Spo0J family partition protein [bacterium]|nr:ParB/RepB/Spo0J family partition protein [bacterium]